MRQQLAFWAIVGLILGFTLQGTITTAQNPTLAFGVDSSSGLPVVIQSDGSNALKVVLK